MLEVAECVLSAVPDVELVNFGRNFGVFARRDGFRLCVWDFGPSGQSHCFIGAEAAPEGWTVSVWTHAGDPANIAETVKYWAVP